MSTATMTSKGQITIPKDVRDDLHLTPGAKVMFVRLPSGHYEMVARTGKIEDLAGVLHDPDRATVTVEDMDEAVAAGATEHAMRGSSTH
ncbi:AbrB/MazE/SpoVT family DNA-binding domain-containing protein [Ruania suaedae]|uniref:AbrB/MazE/SpoVT family DNA-binding domain-containing protein n=1 Tax=Ruania suaedae TaxID=2897774 RepID=UPI001E486740|nr:AbrB/MazE/SpoVT family DNA-binding domain-containing protein [Ruania suaedae]UFU01849.1 AbrB/MazE/SpoVT family DNA-binding domain-containing protein [Ruania suaedae]